MIQKISWKAGRTHTSPRGAGNARLNAMASQSSAASVCCSIFHADQALSCRGAAGGPRKMRPTSFPGCPETRASPPFPFGSPRASVDVPKTGLPRLHSGRATTRIPTLPTRGDCRFACLVSSNGARPSAGSTSRRKGALRSGVPTCPR